MQTARRLIVALSSAIVLWVFTSVAGALLDPAHAAFWSSSLMWSFLSTLLVAPALVMIFDPSLVRKAEKPRQAAAAQEPTPVVDGQSAPRRETSRLTSDRRPPAASQRSFVEDAAGAAYPVPEELGEQQTAPENARPDWVGTYAV